MWVEKSQNTAFMPRKRLDTSFKCDNPLVTGYTVLEEHNADRLVWVEPFEDTASEKHSVVYIRYEEVPDREYWKVDKWEIADNYDVERR